MANGEKDKNEIGVDGGGSVEIDHELAKTMLRLCEMVILCAPPFAAGSNGAMTVAIAHEMRSRLSGALVRRKAAESNARAQSI